MSAWDLDENDENDIDEKEIFIAIGNNLANWLRAEWLMTTVDLS